MWAACLLVFEVFIVEVLFFILIYCSYRHGHCTTFICACVAFFSHALCHGPGLLSNVPLPRGSWASAGSVPCNSWSLAELNPFSFVVPFSSPLSVLSSDSSNANTARRRGLPCGFTIMLCPCQCLGCQIGCSACQGC